MNMEKILILSSGNIPKGQKLFFFFMGFVFLLQGIVNLFNNSTYLFLAWLQIIIGLVYIFSIVFYYNKQDRTAYVKLTSSEIIFKKSPLSKEVVLNISDLINLEITNYEIRIDSKSKSYNLNFSSLPYIQRKNELPKFILDMQEFKEKLLLNKNAT